MDIINIMKSWFLANFKKLWLNVKTLKELMKFLASKIVSLICSDKILKKKCFLCKVYL